MGYKALSRSGVLCQAPQILHQCLLSTSTMSTSSWTLFFCLLISLSQILVAAPIGGDEREFQKIVDQIIQVSSSIGSTKVDIYDHIVHKVPENKRLKLSRRILRKLLQIRERNLEILS